MNNSIYDISEEYLNIISEVEEAEGELTPELEERLKINHDDFKKKATAYVHVIRMAEGEVEFINTEIERLTSLATQRLNKIERLKKTLKDAVLLFGDDGKSGNKKVDLTIAKLWTTNRDSVDIENDEEFITNSDNYKYLMGNTKSLPYNDLKRLKSIAFDHNIYIDLSNPIISKTAIKEDLEKNIEINGAKIITKTSLTIR